ncbi:MAG: DUF1648 domain-containing protein [Gordonibacter sp.]|uniref:hypothetical protein n=1 Tax=Gordonibacter sp. TaxID=1968902 RepID=UPI00321FB8AA
MKRSGLIAMFALAVLPLATTGLAVLFVLPDTIPLHAGVHGIDSVGSKYGAFNVAFIMAGSCSLLAIMYTFMDKLAALGFVHGTDAHGGRICLLFCQVFMNVVQLLVLVWMTFGLT